MASTSYPSTWLQCPPLHPLGPVLTAAGLGSGKNTSRTRPTSKTYQVATPSAHGSRLRGHGPRCRDRRVAQAIPVSPAFQPPGALRVTLHVPVDAPTLLDNGTSSQAPIDALSIRPLSAIVPCPDLRAAMSTPWSSQFTMRTSFESTDVFISETLRLGREVDAEESYRQVWLSVVRFDVTKYVFIAYEMHDGSRVDPIDVAVVLAFPHDKIKIVVSEISSIKMLGIVAEYSSDDEGGKMTMFESAGGNTRLLAHIAFSVTGSRSCGSARSCAISTHAHHSSCGIPWYSMHHGVSRKRAETQLGGTLPIPHLPGRLPEGISIRACSSRNELQHHGLHVHENKRQGESRVVSGAEAGRARNERIVEQFKGLQGIDSGLDEARAAVRAIYSEILDHPFKDGESEL
ncbi:uncharacterized protein BXZ73DRAFT_82744 [Epithele typhae]|uniref:uncharacterized protein n=1 Tax=Epithele typhae TaxID=378194 RepID=UPI0020085464|nr:uncharacterized protein BXZ73DRAFT_82744 [Epithele typhae]KAH9911473.1 hypothetical protein BXZ73DRAFT_82744 [Epithele typhae]